MRIVRPLLVLALATLSCQVILGFEEPQGIDGQPGPDGTDAAVEGGDPCRHARPPLPPAKDDDPGTKKAYWLATTRIDTLKPDGGVKPGYDLDEVCTCLPDLHHDGGAPCRTPVRGVTCDRANGVDDGLEALSSVAGGIALPSFDYADSLNGEFANGTRMLLLFIKNYNGKANDTDVDVDFVGSGGIFENLGCANEARANLLPSDAGAEQGLPGTRYAPLNDGCDRWSPAPTQTLGSYPNREPRSPLAGYVSNFDLVVFFKEAGTGLFGGTTKLANGVAVAHLSTDPNGKLRAEGILAGRIGFKDLVDLVARTPVQDFLAGGEIKPFCETRIWDAVPGRLCETRDTMLSSADQFLDKTCDGTSMAFAFKMVEAQMGDLEFSKQEPPSMCADSAIDCPQ